MVYLVVITGFIVETPPTKGTTMKKLSRLDRIERFIETHIFRLAPRT